MATLDDFKKLEIITAKVVSVEDHPDADRLYVLKIDMGDGDAQIVAGIKPHYSKEALLGKHIVVIKNLKPVVIRGVESNGMLLAAKDTDKLSVLIADRELKPGSTVS